MGSTDRHNATISSETKFEKRGISPNAVATTPATEPTVLTKKTRPAPASACTRAAACRTRMAIRRGFMAEVVTSGTPSSMTQARNEPVTRSVPASSGKTCGYMRQAPTSDSALSAGMSRKTL